MEMIGRQLCCLVMMFDISRTCFLLCLVKLNDFSCCLIEVNGISSLAAESNIKQKPVANYVVLDEVSQVFDLACLCIKNEKVIGLSMEGLNAGQLGEPSWIQVCKYDWAHPKF